METDRGNKTLFDNLYLTLTPEQLKECGRYTQVFEDAAKLREKSIYILRDGDEVSVGWINYVKRNRKTGVYEVEVSKEIMPELVELATRFHTYELTVALTLKSVYSQRIYELCSQYKHSKNGYFFRDISTLQELFDLPKSYEDYSLLKARVLKVAQKEIKEMYDSGECDLFFDFKEQNNKKGKKVMTIDFFVTTKEGEQNKITNYSPDDAIFFIKTYIAPKFKRDKKYIERIISAIQLKPDISNAFVEKVQEKIGKYDPREQPAIIRYVLNEDFGIK